eukprot:CAMPEP_0202721954 /NCGR_PEP_ID=MMETSP1385-20130828/153154_1 /ASSEMBLY_ACC=CAM_ASM_000861 /TAXON_ID=933848 /ORGANISM="Elphidium margaritaceum" /LENGTH=154 /DNA_ID=CAMNT_0049386395 /DNA_START=152 /DNA_END=613 /DNA_ORIENTATION=-
MTTVLKQYNMFDFHRIYDGLETGLDAFSFHALLDGVHDTLVIIESSRFFVFGGFTTIPWSSGFGVDELTLSKDDELCTFMFSLRNNKNHPIKFRLKSSDRYAVGHSSEYGPCFGDGDLTLGNEQGAIQPSSFDIAHYSQLCDKQRFVTTNIEVY